MFLYFYVPGNWRIEQFNRDFEVASSKYSNNLDPTDDIVFMRVATNKHLNFSVNKMWAGRIAPYCEAYYLNEKDEVELADFGDRYRSKEGIESFFVR